MERPHEVVRCLSAPGIGIDHAWVLTLGGQSSEPSSGLEGFSRYKPPVIRSISGIGSQMADTQGGQAVILSGESFGPATPLDENGAVVGIVQPLAW